MRERGEARADELAHVLAAAVEMGAHGVERHAQGGGDGVVAEVLLVVEDEDGALGFGEGEERGVDRGLELGVGEKLLGGAGVGAERVAGEIFEPLGGGVVVLWCGWCSDELTFSAAALPLVLRDVDDDAVEVGGEGGVATEVGEGAVEAEEDLLGEVFDVGAGGGHAREGAEDHGLMLADEGFEGGWRGKMLRRWVVGGHGVSGGSDFRIEEKFQGSA
jgi:hypothetical protein